ncbi:hypothetical protein UUU_36650 (plasmid) [Klebsiella pneumoniae subsp. pneumoniae DSM 30104 = JCM 1662 = NBRC 14940]|nr:hypothetical protein UUU_36650 [Klebsiella pneumoniae subsp. pneumoniae DSM 30104 = JCM 1662 = NBRC 14940]
MEVFVYLSGMTSNMSWIYKFLVYKTMEYLRGEYNEKVQFQSS